MRNRNRRSGFTLVELMVVVIIICLIVGLLLPALAGAYFRAKEATVTTEINSLSTALATFKSDYGCFPPSRVLLCEDGSYFQNGPNYTLTPAQVALIPRSISYLRKIFPRVQLNTSNAGLTAVSTPFYDFNGDGVLSPPIVLQGHECLVFFLGGIPQQSSPGIWFLTGFCTSPVNPFANPNNAPNRSKPEYDFDSGRLMDSDGNGFPEYYDSFSWPQNPGVVVYFSGYEGVGYDPDDLNLSEPDDTGTYLTTNGGFTVGNDPTQTNITNSQGLTSSPSPNPLTTGPPTSNQVSWWKPQGFQLLTSGRDRLFGISGMYDPSSATNALPFYSTATVTGQNLDPSIRNREWDNLTNLTTGKLNP